jgi:hypothetical protein
MQPKMDEKFEEAGESASVLDDTTDTKEEKDVKRTMLHCLNEVSDLHERIKKFVVF